MINGTNGSRYEEILDELSELSEWEIRSYALNESDLEVVNKILEYKAAKQRGMDKQGIVTVIEEPGRSKVKLFN